MYMIIGGEHISGEGRKTIEVINPATQEIIDTVPAAGQEDIDRAVANAGKGLKEWSQTPLYERINCVYRFADLLEKEENFKKLVEYEITENGKPVSMGEEDIHCSAYICRAFAEKARNFTGDMIPADAEPGTKDDLILTVREPIGIVVNIVPFNYPTNLYCFKTIPALLMGNSVIVKPASDTPLANVFITDLLLEAGVPANALQILTGRGDMGDLLVSHPGIDFVSVTGSCETGKSIMERCAGNLHQCHMELGGNDPMIIFEDCDLDKAVKETVSGRIGNAGQTCCASKRYIVQNSIRQQFVTKLKDALGKVKIGDLHDYETEMGPVISEKAAIEVERQINHTIAQGAKLVYGGHRFNHAFIEPTILDDVTGEMDVAHEMEIFGPVFPIIGFDTIEEAVSIANDIPYGLQSAVMTEDIKKALYIARKMEAGSCIINGSSNYRHNHQAFGGHKKSGFGHEGVAYTLAEMSNTKTIALKKIFA
ncbi:MAG: aldehyde dehydrogenase family protein [Lachnospiraceae bacterium]|mgnify:CR=1 FL=1